MHLKILFLKMLKLILICIENSFYIFSLNVDCYELYLIMVRILFGIFAKKRANHNYEVLKFSVYFIFSTKNTNS